MEWIKRIFPKRESHNANAAVEADIARDRKVVTALDGVAPMYKKFYDSFATLTHDEFYAGHKELHTRSIVFFQTYAAMFANTSGTLKEQMTERYRQMVPFMDDLEQHARSIMDTLGIDQSTEDDLFQLTHPKVYDHVQSIADLASACQTFIDAYESAYPDEAEGE